jgi:hypothetical protein
MSSPASLRRLIDLPGVDDLELRALMKPAFAEPEARAEFPEIDALSLKLFGLTADQAEDVERPSGWDRVDRLPIPKQVEAFEAEGWDVTDNKRRPLRVLGHFNQQLWLALRGVAGELPYAAPDATPDRWASKLEAEAKRFRKR